MFESNVRTRLGGIAVAVAAAGLTIGHREIGGAVGVGLLALWFFTPAVYAFIGGQVAVVALYPPHGLDWTLFVVEIGLTLVLLSPSVRTATVRERVGVAATAIGCVGVAWIGLVEFGTLAVAVTLVAAVGVAATAASQYASVIVRGDRR